MNRTSLSTAAGYVTLVYWVAFYAVVLQDWYLAWPLAGTLLKALFPVALIANLAGAILAMVSFSAQQGQRRIVALALHGIPLVAAAGFSWWLAFGVSI